MGGLIVLFIAWIGKLAIAELWSRFRARGKRDNAHKFRNLLDVGADLISEGEKKSLEQNQWISRVIIWDQDVRKLLHSTVPQSELLMYTSLGQQPQQNQDRLIVLNTVKDRRAKLRLIMGRNVG